MKKFLLRLCSLLRSLIQVNLLKRPYRRRYLKPKTPEEAFQQYNQNIKGYIDTVGKYMHKAVKQFEDENKELLEKERLKAESREGQKE